VQRSVFYRVVVSNQPRDRTPCGYERLAQCVLSTAIEDARIPGVVDRQEVPFRRLSGWGRVRAEQAREFLCDASNERLQLWCGLLRMDHHRLVSRMVALLEAEGWYAGGKR
jgi:hypothetical protein